jgi:DNA-binding MarR family transcriptional regulator
MRDSDVSRLRVQLRLLARRLRRETLPASGLSRSGLGVLGALTRMPPGAQPREVGAELVMTSSNVAAALRELDAAGLVRRERDPDDARAVRLFVTAPGEAAIAANRSEKDSWLGRAIEELLDDDEQRLLVAAGELIERLAAYHEQAGREAA